MLALFDNQGGYCLASIYLQLLLQPAYELMFLELRVSRNTLLFAELFQLNNLKNTTCAVSIVSC